MLRSNFNHVMPQLFCLRPPSHSLPRVPYDPLLLKLSPSNTTMSGPAIIGEDPLPAPLTLSNADAAQWNRDLMLAFQSELKTNPEADLLLMFPTLYRHEHRNSQYRQLSYAAIINLRTLHELCDTLKDEPEVNILSKFPKNYNRRITMATGTKALLPVERDTLETQAPEFRTRLDLAETARVIFPLSKEAIVLLAQFSGGTCKDEPSDNDEVLIISLKKLL